MVSVVVPRDHDQRPVNVVDLAATQGNNSRPESTATVRSDAGAHQRFFRTQGTARRCIVWHPSARFASSCSRNGTAATKNRPGATSMYRTRDGARMVSPFRDRSPDRRTGGLTIVQRGVGLGDDVVVLSMADRVFDVVGHLPVHRPLCAVR